MQNLARGNHDANAIIVNCNAQTNKKFAALIPLKRFGTVDEIGQLAVFLASPLAAYITGTVVVADGGQNLLGSGILQSLWSEAMTTQ